MIKPLSMAVAGLLLLAMAGCSGLDTYDATVKNAAAPTPEMALVVIDTRFLGPPRWVRKNWSPNIHWQNISVREKKAFVSGRGAPGLAIYAVRPGRYRFAMALFPGAEYHFFRDPYRQIVFDVLPGEAVYVGTVGVVAQVDPIAINDTFDVRLVDNFAAAQAFYKARTPDAKRPLIRRMARYMRIRDLPRVFKQPTPGCPSQIRTERMPVIGLPGKTVPVVLGGC